MTKSPKRYRKIYVLEECIYKLRKLHRYHELLGSTLDEFKDKVDGIELSDEMELNLVSSHILAIENENYNIGKNIDMMNSKICSVLKKERGS